MKKTSKIDVDSDQFAKEAANIALSMVTIMQCRKCTHPVISGHCCMFCNSDSPTSRNDEPAWVQL